MLANFFNYATRRKWVAVSPLARVVQKDLPTIRRSKKYPFTVEQANQLLEFISEKVPHFLIHFALRLFIGVRTAESKRFQWEWIQRGQNRILIPGWFLQENDEIEQGVKTGDDWSIDDVAPRFWAIYDAEPRPNNGHVPTPSKRQWRRLKEVILQKLDLKKWPHNATRNTFCTLHMSAYRSAE